MPEVRITQPKVVEPTPEIPAVAEPARKAWSKSTSFLSPKRAVTISMSKILIGFAVVVVLLLMTWATGYKLGNGHGEGNALKDLGLNGGGGIKEPGRDAIPVNPNLVNHELKPPEPATTQPDKQPKAVPAPATVGTDPRVVGLNYYLLASQLDKEEAQKIVDFLNENGLPAAAAVEVSASGVKNPGSYVVFVNRGIKSEEYKARAASRTEVETQAARLGKVWKQERKGKTDLSRTYWERYNPKSTEGSKR